MLYTFVAADFNGLYGQVWAKRKLLKILLTPQGGFAVYIVAASLLTSEEGSEGDRELNRASAVSAGSPVCEFHLRGDIHPLSRINPDSCIFISKESSLEFQ